MSANTDPVKLKRGTAVKIARKLGKSVKQVSECIKGNRKPGPEIAKEIERERRKQAA